MTKGSAGAIDLGIEGIEVVEEIGRGGFAVVYRARQPNFGREVAVKLLDRGQIDNAARGRFARECQAMGSMSDHSSIVTIYGAGFTPVGQPYLVLAYLSGGSLADRLAEGGPMEWREVCRTGAQLADALHAAHQRGIVHRDVKPENVLLPGPGQAVRSSQLTDFGIARMDQVLRVTAVSHEIRGTLMHIAPDVFNGAPPTPLTDVYSLGSTLYELLAGRPAFEAEADEAYESVLRRILLEPPPDLRLHNVPSAVCAVIEQAMAKDPAERFPSAAAMGAALEDLATRAHSGGGPPRRPSLPVRANVVSSAPPRREQRLSPPPQRDQGLAGLPRYDTSPSAPPRRERTPLAPPRYDQSSERRRPSPSRAEHSVDTGESTPAVSGSRRPVWLALAVFSVLAVGAAVLAFQNGGQDGSPGTLDAYDLSELSVTFSVAQDLDPVRQIVAAASTEALSSRGADVMTATPLTSADQRSDLQTGTADMYVDYDQAADLANGVVWLGPAPANVGPGIAVVDDGLTSVQDVTDRISTSEGKLCVDSSELETATSDLVTLGLDPRDPTSVVPISPTELARALTSGRCIAAYVAQQTDARLTGSPSRFVTDGDRQLPIMRIGVALRQGIAADEPDLSQLVGVVLDALDDQQIAALVTRVELGGERPEAVATDWLEDSGLL